MAYFYTYRAIRVTTQIHKPKESIDCIASCALSEMKGMNIKYEYSMQKA